MAATATTSISRTPQRTLVCGLAALCLTLCGCASNGPTRARSAEPVVADKSVPETSVLPGDDGERAVAVNKAAIAALFATRRGNVDVLADMVDPRTPHWAELLYQVTLDAVQRAMTAGKTEWQYIARRDGVPAKDYPRVQRERAEALIQALQGKGCRVADGKRDHLLLGERASAPSGDYRTWREEIEHLVYVPLHCAKADRADRSYGLVISSYRDSKAYRLAGVVHDGASRTAYMLLFERLRTGDKRRAERSDQSDAQKCGPNGCSNTRRQPRPVVRFGRAKIVSGAIDQRAMDRSMKRNIMMLRHCYMRELVRNPQIAGKMMVHFYVEPTGRVHRVRVRSSTLGQRRLDMCVTTQIRIWRFPRPTGSGSASVIYPILFSTR